MVKIAATITAEMLRAVERAAQDRAAGRTAERVAPFTYRIASSRPGHAAHTVVVHSVIHLQAECDCEAGQHGKFCRHQAAAICEASRRWHAQRTEMGLDEKQAPAPTYGPATLTGAEIEARMERAFR